MHESLLPLLEETGIDYDYLPEIKPEEVVAQISNYEILIIRSKMRVDVTLLDKAHKLQIICRAGAGLDGIDGAETEKRGIKIINAPEANSIAVGEHTLGMLLSLMNNLRKADNEIRQGLWLREENRGYEIAGRTVGIIGYGNMGQAFAKRLAGFECEVLMYDKYHPEKANQYAKSVSLEEIQQKADILSLHIPLTSESRNMVDDNFFQKFRKPIWFLNAARGEIVILNDLLKNLESGKIIAAGLDVLENEKLKNLTEIQKLTFKKLVTSEKVLLSPHIGGWTFESYEKINKVLIEKLKILLPE